MLVIALYMLSGHEIKHLGKFNNGCVGPQILIEVYACPWGDKAVLFHLASFRLEALGTVTFRSR
jgi:hypothetical protein